MILIHDYDLWFHLLLQDLKENMTGVTKKQTISTVTTGLSDESPRRKGLFGFYFSSSKCCSNGSFLKLKFWLLDKKSLFLFFPKL